MTSWMPKEPPAEEVVKVPSAGLEEMEEIWNGPGSLTLAKDATFVMTEDVLLKKNHRYVFRYSDVRKKGLITDMGETWISAKDYDDISSWKIDPETATEEQVRIILGLSEE